MTQKGYSTVIAFWINHKEYVSAISANGFRLVRILSHNEIIEGKRGRSCGQVLIGPPLFLIKIFTSNNFEDLLCCNIQKQRKVFCSVLNCTLLWKLRWDESLLYTLH